MSVYIKENNEWIRCKEFNLNDPETGQWLTYPSDQNFLSICKIPKHTALTWLQELNFSLQVQYNYRNYEIDHYVLPLDGDQNYWLNKLAIIISANSSNITCLYNH